eukprot:2848735-Pyramimonas_sp.AAC.1
MASTEKVCSPSSRPRRQYCRRTRTPSSGTKSNSATREEVTSPYFAVMLYTSVWCSERGAHQHGPVSTTV